MFEILATIYCLIFGSCTPPPCTRQSIDYGRYIICRFDAASAKLSLKLNDANGKAYGSISALRRQFKATGIRLEFAMNGGMYHEDFAPVGLYVENGIEKKPISTGGGYGNFHLLPNGVFFFGMGKAGVLETGQYISSGIKPQFATQSGPMLVIDGKIHPRFLKNSDSLKIRNGVGVSADGKDIYFAISQERVRFRDFAMLFRDQLKTPNALFLDGSISSLYSPVLSQGTYWPAGPIIVITK